MPFERLSLTELLNQLDAGECSCVELMGATLDRVEATHSRLNAVVGTRPREELLADAESADRRRAAGEAGPLEGAPLGVKDLEDVAGMVTSMGSRVFRDNVAGSDSTQVARLRAAGAIVVGKTNTPEFGFTAITKNPLFGVSRSPWNLERTPGGSSGGSAAVLAGGVLPLVTSSDGGGSIRIPASFTGAFGLKPSQGRVPRGPGSPLAPELAGALTASRRRRNPESVSALKSLFLPQPRQMTAPPAPRPADVRDNDWRAVELPGPDAFVPVHPVSVVVPCFEAPAALALTLAGLERQTWPRGLFEVVVVDDGSEPPLAAPATPLRIRVVRQERRGFGLARARNAGARAAAHDILVFLDGDVIPEAELLAAHARWCHAVSDVLTQGFCAFAPMHGIDPAAVRGRPGTLRSLFRGRPVDPPWLERHMVRTADLTARRDDLFRAFTGHNFAIRKAFFDEVGGFDETFDRYGGEDTEFGYRACVRGGLLVPVREAFGWHQGRWATGGERKARDQALQRDRLAELIADPGFRPEAPGRVFAVPRHVVDVAAGGVSAARVAATVAGLLDDPAGDLAVRVGLPPGREGDRARLARRFRPDPRVRIASGRSALDEFPASPFHVALPAGAPVEPGLVGGLRAALGAAAAATAALGDGTAASIARARALHRARRTGTVPADCGAVRTVRLPRPRRGDVRAARRRRRAASAGAPAGSAAARVWAEARHVRGPRTAWRLLRWLAAAVRWRLRRGGAWQPSPALPARARADPPLGVELATVGRRARAVFAASSRVTPGSWGQRVDAALADSPAEAAAAASAGVPVALLTEAPSLAAPAFDPALHNPVGWVRHVEHRAAALGPPGVLPPVRPPAREAKPGDVDALRHCHHLEDTAGFHADAATRAGTLARLAARGVPVHLADGGPGLDVLLGAELHGLMRAEVRSADTAEREALSIAMRRAALRGHTLRARARQVCEAAGVAPPPPPRVSVLLATRRPALLARAVAAVAAQRYPRVELVLALHGPGFDPGAVEAALAGIAGPVRVLRLASGRPLGAVLRAAAEAARGTLLAKMDDDDVYGPEHLWDLVLAREYSGAALVGKFPATVYLARRDRTVRCRPVPGETWSRSITGGTMLIGRADLERAGGWRPAPRHVDRALVDDVVRAGGSVYRTHDAGYLLVRHGGAHTWETDDAFFLAGAEAVRAGWRPSLAGIAGAPPPPAAPS